jgi:hypothetical protein
MAINRVQRAVRSEQLVVLLIVLIIAHCSLLSVFTFAQENHFFLETRYRFVQRLAWTTGENVMRYEVVIEREGNGTYIRVFSDFTAETFIEVSLPSGNYRYRLIPYDFLNRPGQPSVWMAFEILPALVPEMDGFSPESFTLNSQENFVQEDFVLTITGRNFEPEIEIYIRRPGFGGANTINPIEIKVSQDGTEVMLYFNADQLEAGIYLIHAKNPSGLESSFGDFLIKQTAAVLIEPEQATLEPAIAGAYYDSLDLCFSLGWLPVLYMHGNMDVPAGSILDLNGFVLRFGAFVASDNFVDIGLELTAAMCSFSSFFIENNLLLRRQFMSKKPALIFRLGAGFILPAGKSASELLDTKTIYANTGLSFLWLAANYYLEIGANYSYIFAVDNYSGIIKPWIGFGYRFAVGREQ